MMTAKADRGAIVFTRCAKVICALAAMIALPAPPSRAALNRAGDPNAPPLAIVFTPGHQCWRYAGKEAYFRGTFRALEHVIISSAGEMHTLDGATGRELAQVQMRDVSIQPVKGSLQVKDAGNGEFIIPESGAYDVSLWPHAMQGYPGMVVICKR